jgi:peptidoglycan hydrolase CwlO-like protein
MVYVFGDERILAHCIEDACVTLQEQKLESLKKELKAFQWELNELDIAMAEIEDEIENKQLEISKLQKEIAQQISLHKSPPVDPNQIPLL